MKKSKKSQYTLNKTIILLVFVSLLISSGIVILAAAIINAVGVNLYILNAVGYLVIALILALGISVLISMIIGKPLARYVNKFRDALNQVANGKFDTKLNKTKSEYVNNIINDYNKMVDELNSVQVLRNDFISNISHEYKTPLSSIKGFAELIQNKKDLSDNEKDEYCKIIIEECVRLSELTSNTLLISKLDTQTNITNVKKIYIDEQIDECLFLLDNQIKDKKIKLKADLQQAVIYSDPNLTKQIWLNILSNAIKFTKNKINIDIMVFDSKVQVTVEDNGVGISEDQQKYIFDKFYQADTSRACEGTGLGLSIVKRIIDLHNGQIDVESQKDKFTKIIITLPNRLN